MANLASIRMFFGLKYQHFTKLRNWCYVIQELTVWLINLNLIYTHAIQLRRYNLMIFSTCNSSVMVGWQKLFWQLVLLPKNSCLPPCEVYSTSEETCFQFSIMWSETSVLWGMIINYEIISLTTSWLADIFCWKVHWYHIFWSDFWKSLKVKISAMKKLSIFRKNRKVSGFINFFMPSFLMTF